MPQVLKDVFTFTQTFMYKKMFYIGLGAYFFMLLLSIVYFKERIILVDTGFTLFHLVRTNSFYLVHFRFGEVLTQLLPLILRRAEASLSAIARSYSIAFTLYYMACYVVCGMVLRQYRFALLILLLNVLITAHTFYWPVSQLPQGMALWAVVMATIADKPKLSLVRQIFILLCMITLAFFHPLLVVIVGYSFLFCYPGSGSNLSRKYLLVVVGLFFLTLVVKAIFFREPYEQHSLGGIKNFVRLFPDYWFTYANKAFLYNCITKYYWLPVLFAVVLIHYVRKRGKKELLVIVGSFIGYLMLVNICYPSKETPAFYIENLYQPLAFILLLPFVFDVLPSWKKQKLVLPVLALILISGCARMYSMHGLYAARLTHERQLLRTYGDRKVVISAQHANMELLQMLWCTPYEFCLLSQIEQGRTASIIIDEDPKARGWAETLNKSFVVNWNVFPYKDLPKQYFNFTDTTSGYVIIPWFCRSY